VIAAVRDWLRTASGRTSIPGGAEIARRFFDFQNRFADLCHRFRLEPGEVTFADYYGLAATWLDELTSKHDP
jgi:hypothetical protein